MGGEKGMVAPPHDPAGVRGCGVLLLSQLPHSGGRFCSLGHKVTGSRQAAEAGSRS